MMIASDLSRCVVVAALALADATGHLTSRCGSSSRCSTGSATASSSPARAVQPAAKEGTFREIRSGVRYVSNIPWLWVTITLFAVILMLQLAPQQVLMPELVHEHFDRGVGAYGFLVTMFGAGTVTGTLLFGQLQPGKRRGVVNYSFWLVNTSQSRRSRCRPGSSLPRFSHSCAASASASASRCGRRCCRSSSRITCCRAS
jgi:hypothetical protein